MNHKKWLVVMALVATALILTHLPVSEADAAASASDFQIQGSTLEKYRGSDERVTIPDTVEVVGESAFENNQKVQFVVIPKSVKRLDAYVFWGCNNLEEVVLGKGLTTVDEYSFAGCTGLKQITIPENVQSIDAQAFAGCTNLTDIYIPATVTNIADDAFLNCDNVTIHADEGSVAAQFAQKLEEQRRKNPLVTAAPAQTPATDGTADVQTTEEPAPVEATQTYAEEEKEPYRAEENNAADEGYSSYEEQDEYGQPEYASEGYQEAAYENTGYEQNDAGYEPEYEQGDAEYQQGEAEFQPVIPHADEEEDRELGDVNPYTGKEYQSNSVRMHPTRIGYVQVYDRTIHKWTDMTEWAFLGYQERKKVLLGKAYEPPIYLD